MDDFNKYERVEADDPRRCQHTIPSKGQCDLASVPGGKYCYVHGGACVIKAQKEGELRNYRLTKWQAQVKEKKDSSEIKSLRDEIAILRVMIQERLNYCKDNHDLILASGPISDLVMKVDKVVNSCNRLEINLGTMLDKTQALQFMSEIVEIVAKHVEDEDILGAISDDIATSLERLGPG